MCILSWLLYTLLPDAPTFSGLAYCPNFGGHHTVLKKYGYGIPDNYILDIDLDYFQNPFFESMPYKRYKLFLDLVRNARAITIATEGECVDASSRNYNSSVEEYNIYAQKYNFAAAADLSRRRVQNGRGCREQGRLFGKKAMLGIQPNPYYPSLEGVRVRERGRRQ